MMTASGSPFLPAPPDLRCHQRQPARSPTYPAVPVQGCPAAAVPSCSPPPLCLAGDGSLAEALVPYSIARHGRSAAADVAVRAQVWGCLAVGAHNCFFFVTACTSAAALLRDRHSTVTTLTSSARPYYWYRP